MFDKTVESVSQDLTTGHGINLSFVLRLFTVRLVNYNDRLQTITTAAEPNKSFFYCTHLSASIGATSVDVTLKT